MIRRIVLVGCALLALVASAVPAPAETVSATAGADRVYTYFANEPRASRATLMWQKKPTDMDLFVFGDATPEPIAVAISIGTEERLETAEFGALSGLLYYVVVSKFSGPNSKFYLNVSTAGFEALGREGEDTGLFGLRYLGSLRSLAAADARFEVIRQQVERARVLKAAPAE